MARNGRNSRSAMQRKDARQIQSRLRCAGMADYILSLLAERDDKIKKLEDALRLISTNINVINIYDRVIVEDVINAALQQTEEK